MPFNDLPPAARTAILSYLATVRDAVDARQPAYLAARSRYWQGIRSNPVTPADGNQTATDGTRIAGSHTQSWADLGVAFPASARISFGCDSYQSPLGHGYVLWAEVVIAGKLHRKTLNRGPEASFEFDWSVMEG